MDNNFTAISQLRFWCQKVLPLVYDDSLSYYEVLCKIQAKLNDLIENNNLLPDYIANLIKEYISSGEIEKVLADVLANYMLNVKFPPKGLTPAKGDGTADDTVAIQGCIDYAYSHGGMAVYFPSGKYLTQPLTLRNKATLFGQDRYTTQLVMKGGATTSMFTGTVEELSLTGLGFDGNMDIQVNNVNLFNLTVSSAIISNVLLTDGYELLNVTVNKDLQISNVIFDHAVENGLVVSGQGTVTANNLIFNSVSALVGKNFIVLNTNTSSLEQIDCVGASPNCILINGNNNTVSLRNVQSLKGYTDNGNNNSITVYNVEEITKLSGKKEIVSDELILKPTKPIQYKTPTKLNDYFDSIPFKDGTKDYKVLVEGENSLPVKITEIETNLANETSERISEDALLNDKVNTLNTDLLNETNARINADELLSNRIDDIYISVKKFGAIGDGVHDDSSAFQQAFNYAFDNGRAVFIPGGVYKITTPLKFRPYVQIYGEGKKSILMSYINNGYVLNFDVANEETGPHGVTIRELWIDGRNHTGTGGGITVTSSGHGMNIVNIWVSNFSKANQIGIYGYGNLYYMYIRGCNIQYCAVGIKFDGTGFGVNNCIIRDSKINHGDIGIYLIQAPSTLIEGCQIEDFLNFGIYLMNSNNSKVSSCWLEQNVQYDIRVRSNNCIIENIYTWRDPEDTTQYSVTLEGASNCELSYSNFNNRTGGNKPIYFNSATKCSVVNCTKDSTGDIYTGALDTNVVYTINADGQVYNTEYPLFLMGGMYLSSTAPKNVQNGVIYSSGEGLVQRVDSSNKYVPALSNKQYSRPSIPTSGTFVTGDIVWNTAPATGGSVGWVCITGGTPGTWKAFGTIA